MNVTIADFGTGNLHSLEKALERLGAETKISAQITAWLDADVLVLPGDGAFGPLLASLNGNLDLLRARIVERPTLGICVGMQILFEGSTENPEVSGLSILPGRLDKLPAPILPHMGWNQVRHETHELFEEIPSDEYFYFVHSYGSLWSDSAIGWAEYGAEFVAAVQMGPASFAVQFHPEKSGQWGLQLLENYLQIAQVQI